MTRTRAKETPDPTKELSRERARNAMLVTALRNHRREIDRLTRLLNQKG